MPGSTTTECTKATSYRTGTRHTLWLGKDKINPDFPVSSTETLTVNGAVTAGQNVTITLAAALTSKYWKNQRIRFGTAGSYQVIALAADADVGATELVAKDLKLDLADAIAAIEIPMIPVWSVRATAPTITGNSTEVRNAGACDWVSNLMLTRSHNMAVSGNEVLNDPGHAMLEELACSTEDQVFARLVKAYDQAWEGNFWVGNYSNPQEVDTPVTIDYQLIGDAEPRLDKEWAIA